MPNHKGIIELVEDQYVCTVIQSIRDMDKTKNYSGLNAAVEEIQHYVNRMESGLLSGKTTASMVKAELEKESPKVKKAIKLINSRWKDRY